MRLTDYKILKEEKDSLTVIIGGKKRRLARHEKVKYIPPSRRGKWWKVTGEGKGHSREIKVICNGIEYKSLSDCARSIGVSKSTVSKILAGQKSKFKISKLLNKVA